MTEADLQEIEKRAAAATAGPWHYTIVTGTVSAGGNFVAEGVWPETGPFIAAARTDVPALVAEVRRLQKPTADLVAALEALAALDDEEKEHMRADRLLLDFIGDERVTEAFFARQKWYA